MSKIAEVNCTSGRRFAYPLMILVSPVRIIFAIRSNLEELLALRTFTIWSKKYLKVT